MMLFRRVLAMAVTAGVVTLTGADKPPKVVDPRVAMSPEQIYPASALEHYLAQETFDYVRPGFKIRINSVTIPADRRPVVDYSFFDDLNQPLDRLGQVTPGALSISHILAWWDPVARHYTAYTTRTQTSPITGVSEVQAGTDSGGTTTDIELGHATYRFRTALPEDFDRTKTHTLAIYATRATNAIVGKNYFANVEYDFRPDAAPVTETWAAVNNVEQSCNKCHNPLSAHGGSRQDVKLCATCHQPQTVDPDTGNTVDFKVMVHKIHRGADLHNLPYVIIGNQQSIHDFSDVEFPQDIRNCTTCHEASAAQSHIWYTRPNRAACGSCHDDVNFATGENHPGGAQADDSACASCHVPQGDLEFDASIKGAHTVPYKSAQLKGLNATIVSVENAAPGQKATVKFQLTEKDGTVLNPLPFGTTPASLNLLLAGPTTDYALFPVIREGASGASFDGTVATYTFRNAIPADATGTWAASIEVRRTITLNPGGHRQQTVREAAFNPVKYFAVTDSEPVGRRIVIDVNMTKCNTCHDHLALHGGQRLNAQECVFCHNPNGNDAAEREAGDPAESINFRRMIHRIHTGEELTQEYAIGNGSFNDVRFPGDRRDCLTCHATPAQGQQASYQLPLPEDLLPTATPRDYYSPQQPTANACLGCHDSRSAAANAFVITAPLGEACASCHGTNAEFAVDKVHAR
jgi:OmcA/MtrC family decaheme c-type cytochrome